MRKRKSVIGASLIVGLVVLIVLGLLALCGACWDYSISEWLVYFDKPDRFQLWHGMLISLVPGFGQLAVPVAIFTFIIMLFI